MRAVVARDPARVKELLCLCASCAPIAD